MERITGLEPVTVCLEGRHSTIELHPHLKNAGACGRIRTDNVFLRWFTKPVPYHSGHASILRKIWSQLSDLH